jgi:hypothetical protein
VRAAKKLDKIDLQILLTELRANKMVKEKRKPIFNYASKKIKTPSMEEIDSWKHEARKKYSNK